MRYDHDPKKMAANVANHQVWFHEADGFEWETALRIISLRKANPREMRRYAKT